MIFLKNKGFTLIELILVISIGSLISFLSFQSLIKDQEKIMAKASGQQLSDIGNAVNSYIAVHYDKLSALTNATGVTSDPGPRTCVSATQICTITTQTLINEGILPATFNGLNAFRSGYAIQLKRSGTAPYYNINGLVTTNNAWIGTGNKIRYDLLGAAMQTAGIDSGMTNNSTSKVSGYNGSWTQQNTSFSNINKSGQLAYQVGYGSYSYSIYLRRDGTLPMTGNLNMGNQDINSAKNITASATVQGATLKSTGATAVGTTLNVAGVTTLAGTNVNGALNANNNLKVAGTSTLAGTNVNGQLNANSNFMAAGTSNLRGATTLNSTLNVAGTTTLAGTNVNGQLNANSNFMAAGTSNLRGATTLNSTLNVAGTSTFANANVNGGLTVAGAETIKGVLTVNNAINASGNITSNGQVRGSTVVSGGRATVGEYLQINGTATIGGSCSPNGLQAKSSTGALLSCVNSVWSGSSGTAKRMFIRVNGTCLIPNPDTGICGCPGSSGQYAYMSGIEVGVATDTICSGGMNDHCTTKRNVIYACSS